MIVTEGSTNVSVPFYFVDDVGGTAPGEPTTGLLFSDIETGGSASYQRQGAARVDITAVTIATAATAHADGSFILIDDTEMAGVYRFDIPDAAVAAGADFVIIYLRAAAAKNTITRPLKIDLTTVDLRDGTRGGMTSLPNAAADAAGGLPISDAGGLDLDTQLAATNEVTAARMGALTDWINGGRLDLLLDAIPTTAMRGTDSAVLASTVGTAGAGLTDLGGMSTGMKAEVEAEANDALVALHLDHLLAVDYDPASKPGVATALLNEMVESDAGVSRFTVNALENGPSGSGASAASIADAVWDEAQADHVSAGSFGEIATEIAAIPTTAMRGTDSAALASVCTEVRLAELDAANLPADVAAIPTTAMRGTDNAATAASLATAQTDLDTITGTDGVTLATAQALYAPATAAAMAAAQTDLDTITDTGVAVTSLTSAAIVDVWSTDALTEAYAADGAAATPAQLLYMLWAAVGEFAIATTTITAKKLDGSTTAMTFTLDDASNPTSRTRAT